MNDGERQLLAEAARECAVLRHAFALADWVGEGRPITAKRVLRRADVPVAGRALGSEAPEWVRSGGGSARSALAVDRGASHWPVGC